MTTPKPSLRKRIAAAREAAADWNTANPIGTLVEYTPLSSASLDVERCKTRTLAWVLESGYAVVALEGRPGGVSINHCRVVVAQASSLQKGDDAK
ncbi:MAG: hypothetical protein LBV12_06510 [Puniceicoccales bacterium]|jgi:hypothetical protein|nr:hypothetical protein [Puniceicoccales bacterium]